MFLSSDFGYTDIQSGTLYGCWGALVTVFGLVTGFVVDRLGVASSLRVGFLISFVARCLIFSTVSRPMLLLNVLVLLPLGNCLGIPVLATGIRRYTSEASRGFAFGLFYVVMNVAALLSGPVVDACTILYKGKEEDEDTHWQLTGYRLVILTGIVANAVACAVSWSVREIKLEDDQTDILSTSNEDMAQGTGIPKVSAFQPIRASTREILRETMQSKNFWRFLTVCLITLNVRMIFRHLDATLPKYMVREFGEDTPKGTIYSINPALIIILVPLVTAATTTVDPLVMIHYGSYISAASVFFLVASTSLWSCVMFVIVLSVGEAIWSPRLYDYTMSVVKEGKEGTYMALSSAPLFLAKLPVGMMSGYLLQTYCPEDGPRRSKHMWLIIGLTTAVSPVLLTLLWSYVSDRSEDAPYDIIQNDDAKAEEVRSLETQISMPRLNRARDEKHAPVMIR